MTTPSETAIPTNPSPPRSYSDHLNESDSVLWSIERDPTLRTTIVAIALLDRPPDMDRLHATLLGLADEVPRFRQKVVETPFRMGPPKWVDDPHFDLDFHLRRVRVASPGDLRSVLDLAGPIAMSAFDKDRPLWEFTVVEGLDDGGAAFIQKVHHSFTDGVGGVELARLFLDDSPVPAADRVTLSEPDDPSGNDNADPTAHHGHRSTGVMAMTDLIADNVRFAATLSRRSGRALPHLVASTLRDPVGAAETTARTVRSIGRLLRPARQPLSTVMAGRGLSRRLDSFDLPLATMLAAAHATDATLNDAFLAGLAGGLRRYHELHGAEPAALRVTMPVNLRQDNDGLGNNKFTPVRFALPVTTLDTAERMRELGAITRRWRREPALPLTELLAGGLNRLPVEFTTSFFGAMLKSIDFVATNVPGIPERSYLAGAEVTREYAFAPPSGAAFSVALMSHVDTCCVGVNMDLAAIPDPDILIRCLREGFDEVITLAEPR